MVPDNDLLGDQDKENEEEKEQLGDTGPVDVHVDEEEE